MLEKIKATAKAWSAPIGALIAWGYVVVDSPSGPVTAGEWIGLAAGVALSFGIVYTVPNKPA